MKRCLSALAVLAALAMPARAHFLWLVPEPAAAGKPLTTKAIFSDSLEPDTKVPVTKVAKTKLWFRTADGKLAEGKWAEGKHAYTITLPDDKPRVVAAVCHYGVFQHGKEEPVLLHYYAKTMAFAADADPPGQAELKSLLQGMGQIPLDFSVSPDKPGPVILWQGKPLAGAEVVVLTAPKGEDIKLKTDADGWVQLPGNSFGPDTTLVGIRVSHTEPKAGKLDGKEYKAVRHYLTFVGEVRRKTTFKKVEPQVGPDKAPPKKEDPAASKLLAEARAARANWHNFPGFTAELTVNFDGKTFPGTLSVSGTGKVKVDVADDTAREWARRELASQVAHRMDNSASLDTPCAFVDQNTAHPLGRAIRVLNDELHSSYRIRDRQIIEVNRQMKDSRFTITVVENRLNAEKKFLPASYVVNYWDVATGALQKSQTHHDTWTRVGAFDLPAAVLVVTATNGGLEARSLTISGHRLSK